MRVRLPSVCCAILLKLTILTSCSPAQEGSATEREEFRHMRAVLPTASRSDTEQTRREVGTFRALFLELCPEAVCAQANAGRR